MIIWINGAFGSGKSQASYELNRRIPDSFLYDPENAGYFIRKNVPDESKVSDFQHYPMWREFNYSMLRYLDETSSRIIIVPMTITDTQYFDEIVGRLRREGVTIHHYTLCASREVLLKRLRSRGDGSDSWPAQQIDRCIHGLSHEVFGHNLDTDSMSIDAVVEQIASMSAIDLLPDHRTDTRKRLDRILTQIKQIRLFN
ncbi:AAA family ATPase [Paenibacillus sp. N3/727]|uniref:AAA family ATPase n=1 Tax=Paenibacillus sp. N3/727 TaxID=2925845 RepID=UPI001F53764F|nr:AAA family ATPase [Paenibacillus sp. N3/727]UNK20961.1 AAA family ATPase [Paenibacillus sp. N3/727]